MFCVLCRLQSFSHLSLSLTRTAAYSYAQGRSGGTSLTFDVRADDLAMPTELQCLIAEMNWDV